MLGAQGFPVQWGLDYSFLVTLYCSHTHTPLTAAKSAARQLMKKREVAGYKKVLPLGPTGEYLPHQNRGSSTQTRHLSGPRVAR